MARLPKLKVINTLRNEPEEIRDLEQGKELPFCEHLIIVVENHPINSYEELVQLATRENYRDKEFLVVKIFDIIYGG
ncbi:hypothetical protein ACFLVB_01390 [Chloroflexota bacterium]